MICALVIAAHMGGSISDQAAVVRWLSSSDCTVRIEGECASACTMLLSVGCVTPDARLGFHAPSRDGRSLPEAERARWAEKMAEALPRRIAQWFLRGPAHDLDTVWISGAEAIRLGARRC